MTTERDHIAALYAEHRRAQLGLAQLGGAFDRPALEAVSRTQVQLEYALGVLNEEDPAVKGARSLGWLPPLREPVAAVTEAEVDAVVRLGQLVLDFGRTYRATYHQDGRTPESDTDHTVMLALIACALAARTEPGLDVGLVAQLALVHDLVEVYAGDTATLRIDEAGLADKREREAAALARLREEFEDTLPWLPEMLVLYEEQKIPEARFVRGLDKAMPKITHLGNGSRYLREQGMARAEAARTYAKQDVDIRRYAGEFTAALAVRQELVNRMLERLPEVWGPDDRPPSGPPPAYVTEAKLHDVWVRVGDDVTYPSDKAARAALERAIGALVWDFEGLARQPSGSELWRIVELTPAGGGDDAE